MYICTCTIHTVYRLERFFDLKSLLKEPTDSSEDMIRGLEEEVTRRGAEEEEKLAGAAEMIKKAEEALNDSQADAERWKEKAEESTKEVADSSVIIKKIKGEVERLRRGYNERGNEWGDKLHMVLRPLSRRGLLLTCIVVEPPLD